jgi:hypothetical protein
METTTAALPGSLLVIWPTWVSTLPLIAGIASSSRIRFEPTQSFSDLLCSSVLVRLSLCVSVSYVVTLRVFDWVVFRVFGRYGRWGKISKSIENSEVRKNVLEHVAQFIPSFRKFGNQNFHDDNLNSSRSTI